MPPVKTPVPPQAAGIYDAYRGWLAGRGVGNRTFDSGARCFLARFPDPHAWAGLPLAARLAGTRPQLQPLLNFLMLHGHLRPGYDYLLDRKLTVILREASAGPPGPDLKRFLAGAEALGYSVRPRTGMASEVAIRMLIQAGRALGELTADFRHPQPDAVMLEQRRHRRVLAGVERPLVLPYHDRVPAPVRIRQGGHQRGGLRAPRPRQRAALPGIEELGRDRAVSRY